ncbi:MAG: hypothetical protein UR68_C0031G0009 [Candidatus Roizmanbacteria bacterium GW2011_GWA2_35_19]|uniref:Uncharacterized protein n=2 Tax=Candidatus Roizmaniibacteriota TaxID=1752723 RepID=A0A0G0C657_9BACT|nr:MAG: hypothetical protein UR63_C0044G0001 [Candidatus Roizmanbacteria bacterium GW2011_GWC2_35_12]KKP71591.1 MAG: hypothetical protein UR68_C0031G0009 [Candidatus Roizmanbacteria bacterium GW2011_GWA2_35_19]
MITDKDVTKLKKTFVTKNEFKKEMKDAFEKNTGIIVKEITTVIKMVGEINQKLDKNKKETDDVLDDHERRLDKVEDKVFSQA